MDTLSFLLSYASLETEGCNLTYIWIDGSGERMRCKTKRVKTVPKSINDCPAWYFCGIATGQAPVGSTGDVSLVPVALYKDPVLRGDNRLVLCEVLGLDSQPALANKRKSCAKVMTRCAESEPWFAFEQEFYIRDRKTGSLLDWPRTGFPGVRTYEYFCGIGADARARTLVMSHSFACEYAGITTSGTNAEALMGQWEYQIGPSIGIKFGDDVWVSRFLLIMIAEQLDLEIIFDPKPVPGYHGSGGHVNFSKKQTREPGGLKVIEEYIQSLAANHGKHIAVYDPKGGADNRRRLTGALETSPIEKFTSGVGDRNNSIRINKDVVATGCGYLEDRRPASNADPYSISEILVRTCCLKEF